MNKISDTELMDGARDYRLMTRQFVNALLELKEYNRFSKGLFGWVGFKTKWIEFENVEELQEKQNGLSGNYYYIALKESLLFQQHHWRLHRL